MSTEQHKKFLIEEPSGLFFLGVSGLLILLGVYCFSERNIQMKSLEGKLHAELDKNVQWSSYWDGQKQLYAQNQQKVLAAHPELKNPNHPLTRIIAEIENEFPTLLTNPGGPFIAMKLAENRYENGRLKAMSSLDEPVQKATASDNLSKQKYDKWRNLEDWRSVRKGMSKDQVRNLLGEPNQISHNILGFEDWIYGSGRYQGGGQVTFGLGASVEGWDEPEFNN
ncbi:MAG: hypothetical protein A2Y02_00015 [Omnitrophica bacterium GWA2_52_12]|nr:MAG: hypothetical protein A2Y02_00015 [Omnitrophica bacterium GWA2_52_12]